MFKNISESSENDPEQLAHTSENSPALSESHSTLKTKVFVLLCHPLRLIWQCQDMEVHYSVEYRRLKRKAPSLIWLFLSDLIQIQLVRYQSQL
jgi:hypothetical protein